MTKQHELFIKEQAQSEYGKTWLEIFKALATDLYSTRGVNESDWKPRQIAAQIIESELSQRLELHEEKPKPQMNKEYI